MELIDEYNLEFPTAVIRVPPIDHHQAQQSTCAPVDISPTRENMNQQAPGGVPILVDLTAKEQPGGEVKTTITSPFRRPKADLGQYAESAIRVLRTVDKDGDPIRTELLVGSPHIQKALREILPSYAYLNLAADPIVIPKPYHSIFHYREELQSYADSTNRSLVERTHMKVLMEDFKNNYVGETLKIFNEEVPKGRVQFDHLWTLFRGEDEIIHHPEGFRELHRVVHCEYATVQDSRVFNICTWRWGYSAGKFGPCSETITIPDFTSTRQIQQLPCFPSRLLEEDERRRLYESFIKRGRKWRNLIKPAHRYHSGNAWVLGDVIPRKMSDLVISHLSGRIVLDCSMYSQEFPHLNDILVGVHGYRLNTREIGDHQRSSDLPAIRVGSTGAIRHIPGQRKMIFNQALCHNDDSHYNMTDEQALLCPARTRGFSLTDKKFALFLVDGVSDINYASNAFDRLVLRPRFKNTVLALVKSHKSTSGAFDDIVQGKGKGMIMLLEGPPGSGKTLTAESVSELTKRPLYAVSTSELGTKAEVAERGLRAIFQRAVKWNAIVLIDEADLFLVTRTAGELDRNALVTVFLRTLEYFRGVMFLTSNRVDDFDPAFHSRIHLRIPFPSPDCTTRAAIWKNFLPSTWDQNVFDSLGAEIAVNGREIKNLTVTSQLVAAHENRELSEELIRDMYATFYVRDQVPGGGDLNTLHESTAD